MKAYHSLTLALLFTLFCGQIIGQYGIYTPIKINTVPNSEYLHKPLAYNDSLVKKETVLNKMDAREFYAGVNYSVWSVMSSGRVYFDGKLTAYLNSVLKKLLTNRMDLLSKIKIYAVKNSSINAVCYPDGHVFVNTGLLTVLENEDQLAFIIAHEIVHYLKTHTKNSISKKILINSADANDKNSAASTYRSLKFSRENEFEADASGLQLLINSPYDASVSGRALELLEKDIQNFIPNFPSVFNNSIFTFDSALLINNADSAWLSKLKKDTDDNEFIFNNKEDIFSTHPDMEKRILALAEVLKSVEYKKPSSTITTSEFTEIKSIAEHELINNLYSFGNYTLGLYYCLKFSAKDKNDPYYHIYLLKNLHMVAYLKSVDQLEKTMTDIGYSNENGINITHYYLSKLSATDLRKMAYGYMKNHSEALNPFEDYVFYQALLTESYLGKEAAYSYYTKYSTTYPNGKYITIVKKKQ